MPIRMPDLRFVFWLVAVIVLSVVRHGEAVPRDRERVDASHVELAQTMLATHAKRVGNRELVRVAQGMPLVIGVLSTRPQEQTRQEWKPIASYLTRTLSYHPEVRIQPMTFHEIDHAIAQKSVDLVFTNSGHYVINEVRNNVAAIASAVQIVNGRPVTRFGGVLFTLANRADLRDPGSIHNERVAAVAPESVGGFLSQVAEILPLGIDLRQERRLFFTDMPHDKVVDAVRAQRADVGLVRTGVLETMAAEGKIQLDEFRVLLPKQVADFPFQLSTALYPEWVMAALPHVPVFLRDHLGSVLLAMPYMQGSTQVERIDGWTLPGRFQELRQLLQDLRVAPYAEAPAVRLRALVQDYWIALLVMFMSVIAVLSLVVVRVVNATHALRQEVTLRHQAEIQLRELSQNLESLVEQRTAELVRATRARSEFLTTVSHEIRTPLNAMIGTADLLGETALNDNQRRQLRTIQSAGDALLGIINDVLDMARIESGRMEINAAPFFLRSLLATVCEIIAPNVQRKDVVLTHVVPDTVPDGWNGDVVRLRQILLNLLGNAAKFTERGRIELSVQPQGTALLFAVQDTGIGIPADQHEAVFDQFVQSDASITRRFGGTGLGLAITRRLVEMMGGTIWVESQVGVGSRFLFTLPLEPLPASAMQEARLALLPAAPVTTGRPLRLLIVDDAEENRALLQAYLARTPHLLTFAEHGAQAVDQYMRHPFDLVLMDMQMPVMDGLEATGRIRQWERQHPEHPVTPIVAVTADALPEHRERSLAAGCTAHLTKPIRKVALLAAIAQFATGPVPETLPAREV